LLCPQVVAVAATFCEVWGAAAALIAELDVLAGFADLATADPTRPYCKPEILELDDGVIELRVSSRNGLKPSRDSKEQHRIVVVFGCAHRLP
jgi:DNA mismatch repair ATPase MutS